jgi:hypothetical protein
MSNRINDGGPIHPINVMDFQPTTGEQVVREQHPGMSLRAYIAAKAMQAVIGITTPADAAKYNPDDLQAATARAACGYADALIAELSKEGK